MSRNSSALATDGLTEIHRAHLWVRLDLPRRPLGEHRTAHHHRDALGKAKYHLHVMLDDEHRDMLGKPFDGVENDVVFGARHTSCGLVEQQYLGPESYRDCKLDEA